MQASTRIAVGGTALLVSLGLGALFVHQRLEQALRDQLGKVLDATLDASSEHLEAWLDSGLRAASAAASSSEVRDAVAPCVRERACAELERALGPYIASAGFENARLVDNRGVMVARITGQPRALDAGAAERVERASGPHARVLGAALAQPVRAVMLAAVVAEGAVLVVDQPLAALGHHMRATRVGRSGETYVFDARGRMLTPSRFRNSDSTAPAIELRVPAPAGESGGGAPTLAVQRAMAHGRGRSLEGYRDYRGVAVVGSYRFSKEHQLGVITELDVVDAYRTLATVERAFIALAGLSMVLVGAGLALLARGSRLRARAELAEQRAQRYGQYQLVEKLGEGGMGAVYLASHALLRRKAAIKLLRADRTSSEAIERFEREVQVTATLTHPNTVAIYDYGRTDDGTFYYVMESLDGLDLQRLVALTGPLPQARVLALLRQVCGSLAEAHAAGVVHRDVKPANLFVCTRGGFADTIKVLDFGIVCLSAAAHGELTIHGTPEYMAPELFESASSASPQSDLYSLGVVAYYLLSGAPPWSGGSTEGISHAHLTEPPPPLSELVSEPIDRELEAAITSCLRKEPSARPSNANALIALLNRSKLADQWTQADATAWWTVHGPLLKHARVSTEPESSKRSIMISTRGS